MLTKFREMIFFLSVIGAYSVTAFSAADNGREKPDESDSLLAKTADMAARRDVPDKNIREDSRAKIRALLEECSDAHGRGKDFNPETAKQMAMNQELDAACKKAGFPTCESSTPASYDDRQQALKEQICGVQEAANSIVRSFIAVQAMVCFMPLFLLMV